MTNHSLKTCSPVQLWPCLLAYLILSSVAIVLASPAFDLNFHPIPCDRARAILGACTYSTQKSLYEVPGKYYEKFKAKDIGEKCKSAAKARRFHHPSLSLALLGVSSKTPGPSRRVLRITAYEDNSVVKYELLISRYKRLLGYLSYWQETEFQLAHYAHIDDSMKANLRESLFGGIHEALLEPALGERNLPLIGVVDDSDATWETLDSTDKFTPTQKM
ncbi:hypothetical protein PCASD_15403 [Puccinia coronata f. sp. avenae]|uniref:Uncharacterized protein n=1 Tax=Puccinia coronata f. sp. avenae TaxID=200324 RepID=A0A2N5TZ46_9BASI|nr:hypothetical protein PCASD_16707 [Puccinia coronata f. sp. avenae]PLW30752.1 hypothetical protein PCASD_15403 [Puccinia coronata f. sp. avenae]